MTAFYNEIDPYAAQWLRNLIGAGHIAPGVVDERSIADLQPADLDGFTQCHFFAGIGGWSYALRLAGWADDRPVWTGSCPCQPFSQAGAQRGSDDERHLWPAFFRLIRECRPGRVFGEQVAGAAGLAWLDHVCADLEGAGYAAAAANLCAAGAGAPHIRQRLYWVADSNEWGSSGHERSQQGILGGQITIEPDGVHDWVAEARQATERADALAAWRDLEWLPCSDGKARPTQPGIFPLLSHGVSGRVAVGGAIGEPAATLSEEERAHLFNRIGTLRGAGNAIVPQVAAAFIEACIGTEHV